MEIIKEVNRKVWAIALTVAMLLSLFLGVVTLTFTKAEVTPEYPDITELEKFGTFDEGLNGLSEGDIEYFMKNFLGVFEDTEMTLIQSFLEGQDIERTMEYDDSRWKQAEEVLNAVQGKWSKFCKGIPTTVQIEDWKTAQGNVNLIMNYASTVIQVVKCADYANNFDDNSFEQAYHKLQASRSVLSEISSKLKTPYSKFFASSLESYLKILEDTYYIASYLHDVYVQESVTLYEYDCMIAYYAGESFTQPEAVENDELKAKQAVYLKWMTRRMLDDFKKDEPSDTSLTTEVRDYTVRKTINYNGHVYSLINAGLTWDHADAHCRNLGGHLLTITASDEQAAVERLLSEAEKHCYWMGATKINNVWSWITGENWGDYTNWARGEPNNSTRSGYEDRLMIYNAVNTETSNGSGVGYWNDLNHAGTNGNSKFYGLNNFGLICEWDDEDSYLDSQLTSKATSRSSGKQFSLYENPVSKEAAFTRCQKLNGQLASYKAAEENKTLKQLIRQGSQNYYWVDSEDADVIGLDENGELFSAVYDPEEMDISDIGFICEWTTLVNKITPETASVELKEDDTFKLNATLNDRDGYIIEKPLAFSSSDETIATVSEEGILTAVNEGTAEITVKADDVTAIIQVIVNPDTTVATLKFEGTDTTIKRGESTSINATAFNKRGKELSVAPEYSSSDEKVCVVDENGLIRTVGEGVAVITAKIGDVLATATITVKAPDSNVVKLKSDTNTVVLTKGESFTPTVRLINKDGIEIKKDVSWTSDNIKVATVSNTGTIKGAGIGNTYVVAKVDGVSTRVGVIVEKDTAASVFTKVTTNALTKAVQAVASTITKMISSFAKALYR